MACRPEKRPFWLTRIASSVKSAARAVASPFLYASSVFPIEFTKLLDYLWIDRVFLLGEGWQDKADCQPY